MRTLAGVVVVVFVCGAVGAAACGGKAETEPLAGVSGYEAAWQDRGDGRGGDSGNGGSGHDCNPKASLVPGTYMTLGSTPYPLQDGPPTILWTGTQLWVVSPRQTQDLRMTTYVAALRLTASGFQILSETTIPGRQEYGFGVRAVWNGSELSVLWAESATGMVRQRFDQNGSKLGGVESLVTTDGMDLLLVDAEPVQDGILVSWEEDESKHFIGKVPNDGKPAASTLVLSNSEGHEDPKVAAGAGHAYGLWCTVPEYFKLPSQSTLAVLDPATGAPESTVLLNAKPREVPVEMVIDEQKQQLILGIWNDETWQVRVLTRNLDGGEFTTRASVGPATGDPALALDKCGRLATLMPRGATDHTSFNLPQALLLQSIGDTEALGVELALPVGLVDSVSETAIVGVDNGYVVAWVEERHESGRPAPRLRVAYARFDD